MNCAHEQTVRTEYNTLICTRCGVERQTNLSIVQDRPPLDMSPFPYGYSKKKRFAKLLDGVLYPTPATADEKMFRLLHGNKYDSTQLLLKAMRGAKLRDKRYCSLHCFCKNFVSSYVPPAQRDYTLVKKHILLAFETVQFGHLRFCGRQPFFNYSWLLCVFLSEFKLQHLLRFVKKLRCRHRRKHYRELLDTIRRAYKRSEVPACVSDSRLLRELRSGGRERPLDQILPA